MQNFRALGAEPPDPPCLRRLGALPPNPQPPAAGVSLPDPHWPLAAGGLRPQTSQTAPPLRISGCAPGVEADTGYCDRVLQQSKMSIIVSCLICKTSLNMSNPTKQRFVEIFYHFWLGIRRVGEQEEHNCALMDYSATFSY